MNFLEKIRPAKEREVENLRRQFALSAPIRAENQPILDFRAALLGGRRLIAEIKRRAPSHPELAMTAPVDHLARAYRRGGAAALSIVTDEANFGTGLADIAAARAAGLPVIAKDFVLDPVQIDAAWAAGADAVLLIVRLLDEKRLACLHAHTRRRGLAVLVECHDERDTALAVEVGADLIGVNNRDLAALRTDLGRGERLLPHLPAGIVRVSESGLYEPADLDRLERAGADAFLIGHALLRSADPGETVACLSGRVVPHAVRVKVCGLTNPDDARAAAAAGAHLLGLIFAESPRRIDVAQAAAIREALPDARLVGVFCDQEPATVVAAVKAADLDLVQLHGHESPAYCRMLAREAGVPLIRAVTPAEADASTPSRYPDVAYFLVDPPKSPHAATMRGDVLAAAARLARGGGRVFLAGGLGPDDVAEAVKEARPFGVDTCRGVESSPGHKDHAQLVTFMREAGR